MASTLFTPRVTQALYYDEACLHCFQEFDKAHQQLVEKMEEAAKYWRGSESKLGQNLSTQVSVLSVRVCRLAEGVKSYIHEKGVLTPRRSISPRAQAPLTNIHMLRKIKAAQSLQLEVFQAVEKFLPQEENDLQKVLFTKGKKLTFKQFETVKNSELFLLSLTIKVANYIQKCFPSFTIEIDELSDKCNTLLSNFRDGPLKGANDCQKVRSSPQSEAVPISVDMMDIPALQPACSNAYVRPTSGFVFQSKTFHVIGQPTIESQVQKSYISSIEMHGKLIDDLSLFKDPKHLLAVRGVFENHGQENPYHQLLDCLEKIKSRSQNLWSTLYRVRPVSDELFKLAREGFGLCEDLLRRYLHSIEEVKRKFEDFDGLVDSEKLQILQLPGEFEKEYQLLNLQTTPILVAMSSKIEEIFERKIAKAVKRLIPLAQKKYKN